MNETSARISDLAFEAALAGYVVALVCYAIEFASRRGGDVPADQVVGVTAGASNRAGGTSTLTRTGGTKAIDSTVIGALPSRGVVPWGERFGRAAVVVTTVGLAANILSIVARGLATGRLHHTVQAHEFGHHQFSHQRLPVRR